MMARIVASMAGGSPEDYMPKFQQETTVEGVMSNMPGLNKFIKNNDIEVGNGDD